MAELIHKPAAAPGPTLAAHRPTLASLTSLRFVAAFMVLLCHIGIHLTPRVAPKAVPVVGVFHGLGAAGLSFFFILSGFVMTWSAKDGDTVGRFWRRRFFRVYPNHFVALVAVVILAAVAGHALSTRDTVASLLLVQAWIPDQSLLYNLWANTPTWSLAAEAFFYLSFPVLLVLLRKIRPSRLWLAFVVTFLAICAVPLLGNALFAGTAIQAGTGVPWLSLWFVAFFPPARMLEFVLGIVVARLVIHGKWVQIPMPVALVLPGIAILGEGFVPLSFALVTLTAVPLALLVGTAATVDLGNRRTVFRGRMMVFLGGISYAVFVVHWPVVAYGWIGRTGPAWGNSPAGTSTWSAVTVMAVLTIATSILLGWLLHVLVERPAMRRWSRPAQPRRGPEVPVTT